MARFVFWTKGHRLPLKLNDLRGSQGSRGLLHLQFFYLKDQLGVCLIYLPVWWNVPILHFYVLLEVLAEEFVILEFLVKHHGSVLGQLDLQAVLHLFLLLPLLPPF